MQVEISFAFQQKDSRLERCLWESPAFDETEELVELKASGPGRMHRGYSHTQPGHVSTEPECPQYVNDPSFRLMFLRRDLSSPR
jgi:hypothetical protein